jgi:DNA helicase-2/ATP-dependent DNA helicase PcrA
MTDLLADLTDPQREAVTHTDGPLLILAAAGSGKTRVITRRVAHLLQSGVRPGSILAITFTNKAAGEMRARVDAIAPGNRVTVCTFHSFGARVLRQYSDRLGIDKNFTIYDVDDRNKLVKEAVAQLNLDDVNFSPERLAGAISKAKNQLTSPGQFETQSRDFFGQTAAKVYARYEKLLRSANAMDFDDLLYLPAMALRMNEEFRRDLDGRYKYVLVDEYQDTNKAQYEIARRISYDFPNLCVVGDPDQSIYKWRGSDIKNILDFERDFPAAKVIALETNFRSTPNILAAAGLLIEHNVKRKKKALVTPNASGAPVRVLAFDNGLDEAEGVVLQIKEFVKAGQFKYRDCAIFLRINALTRSLESAFVQHGVPFQIVKGFAFYERKENRDVLAYLRLLVNPQDPLAFLRAVGEPGRGVGKVSLDKLNQFAITHEIGLLEAAGRVGQIPEIKGKAATGLKDFHRLMTDLRANLELPPPDLIRLVLEKSGYTKMLKDSGNDEDGERLANIEELITAAQQFYAADVDRTLGDFLEQVALASDVDGWDESSERVSVMTLHAAKGLEFPCVFLMAVEQGLLPHERSLANDEELEEERRLCFVGMTRAMKELYLCHARQREFRGQILYAIPSMFLDELPADVERIDKASRLNTARTAFEQFRSRPPAAYSTGIPPRPQTVKPVATAVSTASDGEYTVGMVVQHEQYGIGQVSDVSGFGALKKIKIRFPAAGEKTFVADKVKLKIAGKKGTP